MMMMMIADNDAESDERCVEVMAVDGVRLAFDWLKLTYFRYDSRR
jgi:hypothetical protein